MKKEIYKVLPYLGALFITIVTSTIYLLSSHYGMLKNRYTFERVFTPYKICDIISSDYYTLDSSYVDIATKTGYSNSIGYIEVDSAFSYIALVKPDSLSTYPSGIYRYNRKNKAIEWDSCLFTFYMEDDYADQNERLLAYSCKFIESSGYMALIFLHFSDIIILNKEGELIKKFKTKDNVPPPSIIRYKDYYLYERGKTFNTNRAAFVYDMKVYVFSLRKSSKLTQYLVDCYSLERGDYLYSFYIRNKTNEDNMSVYSATITDNIVTIKSLNCITKIKMI